jgi:hypothetical protein
MTKPVPQRRVIELTPAQTDTLDTMARTKFTSGAPARAFWQGVCAAHDLDPRTIHPDLHGRPTALPLGHAAPHWCWPYALHMRTKPRYTDYTTHEEETVS